MEHGPLQDALESKCRLYVVIIIMRQQWGLLIDEFRELPAQFGNIRIAGLQDLMHFRNIEQREQQVLHRHEFMTVVAGPLKGLIQTKFQFATQHQPVSSRSGLFHRAEQWVLMLLGNTHDLCHFGLGNLKIVHAADTFSFRMYF